jgi:hypothetical protein
MSAAGFAVRLAVGLARAGVLAVSTLAGLGVTSLASLAGFRETAVLALAGLGVATLASFAGLGETTVLALARLGVSAGALSVPADTVLAVMVGRVLARPTLTTILPAGFEILITGLDILPLRVTSNELLGLLTRGEFDLVAGFEGLGDELGIAGFEFLITSDEGGNFGDIPGSDGAFNCGFLGECNLRCNTEGDDSESKTRY